MKVIVLKIIYTTKKDNYAAVKAAYTHLQLNQEISEQDINMEPMRFYYLGLDRDGNEIYVINYYKDKHIYKNIVEGLARIYEDNVLIVDMD